MSMMRKKGIYNMYFNRKSDWYNNKHIEHILDHTFILRFIHIFIGYPDKVHDAKLFKNSDLYCHIFPNIFAQFNNFSNKLIDHLVYLFQYLFYYIFFQNNEISVINYDS